jgi:RNA-directed DNA polymerase
MQCKLAKWSAENKERKFDRLLRLIANKELLMTAAQITLRSPGSNTPGVDGMTKKKMQDNLLAHIYQLHEELLNGKYEPKPARRIYIPKANGKTRVLGILCLRDRIVQRAMLMAMEPIWENDFHRDSYGFRPKRSVHHAIHNIVFNLQDCGGNVARTKGRWIIEGDLASYFD